MPDSKTQREPRPYPRRCADCGDVAVQPAQIPYDARVKHDGKLHEFHIEALPVDQCTRCREVYFTNDTADAQSAALRQHLGLLQPQAIRERLKELGLTQRRLAEQLRVAEETVSRWLNGLSIQSRALDTLLRVYFRFPEIREYLSSGEFAGRAGNGCRDGGAARPDAACDGKPDPESLGGGAGLFGRRFSTAQLERSRKFRLVA